LYYSENLHKTIENIYKKIASFLELNDYEKEGNKVLLVLVVSGV